MAARQSESAAQLFTGTGFVVVVVLTSGMLIKMAPGIVSETLKVQCHEIFIFQPLQTRGIQSVIKKRKAGGGAVGSGLLMTLLRTLANSHVMFIYCKWGGSLVPDRSGPGFEFVDPEHICISLHNAVK